MSAWLDPLRRALDESPRPVRLFFRDDDAGWADDRLFELLDLFAGHELPIDVAVIPEALTPALARALRARVEAASPLELHQHGFAHVNHEPEGRKCEFGPGRPRELQRRDIEAGRKRLEELLGPDVKPVFTPPWNRCTQDTCDCLVELGFRALSRDSGATPLDAGGLVELPISFDWFAGRKGVRLGRAELGDVLAGRVKSAPAHVGIMFHHALMDAEEREAAGELLTLLAGHDRASCRPMRAWIGEAAEKAAKGSRR
jgi:hypothetical protein